MALGLRVKNWERESGGGGKRGTPSNNSIGGVQISLPYKKRKKILPGETKLAGFHIKLRVHVNDRSQQ